MPAAFEPQPDPLTVAPDHVLAGRSERPWGWFETLAVGEGYLVKRLRILAGRRISLQRHQHRCEHWIIANGEGTIHCDGSNLQASVGAIFTIPIGSLHRATAGLEDLEIIEVQRGELLSEEDIERFEDDFGRVVKSDFNL
ncbi:MAG: phosphomannose isomerase type II C-terminal cupin domain [Cyanobium sp.]